MNILKTITPLIVGAFFLTTNANLPDKVTIFNKTSQDLFIAVSNSDQERTYKGLIIKTDKQYTFEKSTSCYPEYNDYHPNYMYIYSDGKSTDYNLLNHQFNNYAEKIDLNITIENYTQIMEKELTNFIIKIVSFVDKSLVIFINNKTD